MALDIKDLELNALLEITQAINNNLPEKDLYKIYRFTLLADLKVKKMAMFVPEEDQWTCKVHFGVEQDFMEIELPETFRALEEAEVVQEKEPFDQFELVFPVLHKERLLGVVFVGSVHENESVDSAFLRALTNILIVAIENKKLARRELQREAYRKELEIAKKVQNFLFPKLLPKTPRLKIEAVYLPHHDVGGDYYDYIPLGEDRFIVCVADVSGKGVPAALLMSNFQASLRTLARKIRDLSEIVRDLNHGTFVSSNGENFITFFIGVYDFKEKTFEYVNCGHNPSMLFTKDGLVTLEEGTTILGMFDPLPFLETKKIEHLEEFLFFGYTDGLTETFNASDEPYGYDRLVRLLRDYSQEDLAMIHQYIFKSLDDFREDRPYDDDITVISCQVSQTS
ncbi:MAG: PP2C family protein-serine/threonine phosphatase [Cyclobacteriaceae bacterium]|nr:PP2C family protein-serine/threonine phosphatase [Cyclobacteriaceae bacterium HetDA_MAG_MS6]